MAGFLSLMVSVWLLHTLLCFQAVQNCFSSDSLPSTQVHEFLGKKQQVKRKYRTNNNAPSARHTYETFCVPVFFSELSSLHSSWRWGDRCGDIRELNSGHESKHVILGFVFFVFFRFLCQERVTTSVVMMYLHELASSQQMRCVWIFSKVNSSFFRCFLKLIFVKK